MTLTRKSPMKRGRRKDPVSPELRLAVLERDGICLLARIHSEGGPDHLCRDKWGDTQSPFALDLLTIEHVHDGYGMSSKRASSDLEHCVAMCYGGNVGVPSKAQRNAIRAYLAALPAAREETVG